MSGQICLKWNSFLTNIASSFENLWEDEGLVDVTLASDGKCLTAHKVILSASSPFFKKVFQTHPCQHPVIILQDVRFTELEALLIFIYKGEVNIEQNNLSALLKAAETLQIRGLSNDDILTKKNYTKFTETNEQIDNEPQSIDETPKKKNRKIHDNNKTLNSSNLINEKRITRLSSESSGSDKIINDEISNDDLSAVYQQLEMKIEPIEITIDKNSEVDKEDESFEIDQSDGDPGDARNEEEIGTSISQENDKPILHAYQQLPYADLLPNPDVIAAWASSRPMDHLACDIMKILFTPEERILCNVNGKMGKQQFDSNKIHLIREVLIQFSGISPNSFEWEEAWKNCVTKIDTSNRGLKRYLFQRRSVFTQ